MHKVIYCCSDFLLLNDKKECKTHLHPFREKGFTYNGTQYMFQDMIAPVSTILRYNQNKIHFPLTDGYF